MCTTAQAPTLAETELIGHGKGADSGAPGATRERVIEALAHCDGNQTRAATFLGVSRRTLINRMIEFGLPRPRKT